MVDKRVVYRLVMAVSLSLYAVSVFLPWVIEKGASGSWPYPTVTCYVRRFRSFQAEIEVFRDDRLMDLLVLRFLEFWSSQSQTRGIEAYVYQGWVLVLVFQILAGVSGVASVLKQKGRGKRLALDCLTVCLILTLALCIFQLVRQWELQWEGRRGIIGPGYVPQSINFDIGFYLALIGVILWIIPLSYNRLHQAFMPIWDRPLPSEPGIDFEEAWKKYPKALFNEYVRQYPHNPEGVLEWHIRKKMKEGKTREQAMKELMHALLH